MNYEIIVNKTYIGILNMFMNVINGRYKMKPQKPSV